MYKRGGWTSRDSHEWFLDYAVKVLKAFHDYIDIINTFNEPNAYANLAYLLKIFLPKRTNPILRNICFSNMKKAHIKVYDYIKGNYPHIITGISQAHMIVEPLNVKSIAANFIKKLFDFIQHEHMHEYFIHNGKYADYIGFSYYGRILIDGSGFPLLAYEKKGRKRLDELSIEHDDMWELYPQGLYNMLRFFYEKYKKPLIITENGTCTEDDNLRKSNLFKHLTYIKKACDEGLPVLGYFHWSTFDNFELAHGPTRRFGLTYIDYKTGLLNRTIKPSGHYYHDIAMSGKLLEP